MEIEQLKKRLANYPGPHPNEAWKRDTDLTHCTPKEMDEMKRLGITVEQMMEAGFNRGEVHHMLFGYLHQTGYGKKYGMMNK